MKRNRLAVLVWAAAAGVAAGVSPGGGAGAPASAPAGPAGEKEMIQLSFPETMPVKLLVQYVSKTMGINILYDEAVVRAHVMVSSPSRIPKDSLLGLLKSVLKMVDLSLVDTDQPGWKRIVPTKDLFKTPADVGQNAGQLAGTDGSVPVTQVIELKNIPPALAERTVGKFLSQPGGNLLAIPETNLLIVTDYADNVRRAMSILKLMDKPPEPKTTTRPAEEPAKGAEKSPAPEEARTLFVAVKHLPAEALAKQVESILLQKERLGPSKAGGTGVALVGEPRTNQVLIIARPGLMEEAQNLLRTLDVPTGASTKTYRFEHVSPSRIDRLVQQYVSLEEIKSTYKAIVDAESGVLIATAPAAVHEQIASLQRVLDVPETERTAASNSPVRFYKLVNSMATQVLATIRSMKAPSQGAPGGGAGKTISVDVPPAAGKGTDTEGEGFTGPNRPPGQPGQESPRPPFLREPEKDKDAPAPRRGEAAEGDRAGDRQMVISADTGDAVVTADPNTNTIIVVAPPEVQRLYEQLIRVLDRRRPQVLVEVTLVTLDTSGSFSLGVDLSAPDQGSGPKKLLTFSAFGLSTVTADTGALALTPGTGFNGALIRPDVIDVVVRALATSGRAKVLSTPKVLVNDNASATLTSVAEAPYTSVNASPTVSSTSFAGYASAGTTISITPHISEGDHLQLQFAVTMNSFTGAGGSGIPPPRQTNSISSLVTVPDGHAVIVGGLKREDASRTVSKLPWLGEAPWLEYMLSNRTISSSESSLFVFIRPIILRDDEFEDLKYLSDRDLSKAGLPGKPPLSQPQLMHESAGSLPRPAAPGAVPGSPGRPPRAAGVSLAPPGPLSSTWHGFGLTHSLQHLTDLGQQALGTMHTGGIIPCTVQRCFAGRPCATTHPSEEREGT